MEQVTTATNVAVALIPRDEVHQEMLCFRAEKISKTFKHSFMLAAASASDYVVQAACRYFVRDAVTACAPYASNSAVS